MKLIDILSPTLIFTSISLSSKKKVLEQLAKKFESETGIDEAEIFEALCERERLGSTGLGQGVAIPHGRIGGLDHATALLMILDTPIDFDSMDQSQVDVIFSLLVPEHYTNEHTELLAQVAELLNDPNFCHTIRHCKDSAQLFKTLSTHEVQSS